MKTKNWKLAFVIKMIFLLIFFFLFNKTSKSQTISIDSIAIKSNFRCSDIAFDCQKLISENFNYSIDSIEKIEKIWENSCGRNEVNLRIKILVEISKGHSINELAIYYYNNYIEDYKLRNENSTLNNKSKIFENNRSYYSYVPLGEKFDSLTQNLASKNVYKLDNKSASYLLCLLWSNNIDRFDKLSKSRYFRNSDLGRKVDSLYYSNWLNGVFLSYHAGYWFPLNEMKSRFIQNPEYGFSFGKKYKKIIKVDIDLNLRILNGNKAIAVNFDNKTQYTKMKFGLSGGLLLTKQLNFNYKSGLDLRAKITYNGLPTNLFRILDNETQDKVYYSVKCWGGSLGIAFRHRLFRHNTLIFFGDYNYCPYNNDKSLISNIGNSYLSTGICLQF